MSTETSGVDSVRGRTDGALEWLKRTGWHARLFGIALAFLLWTLLAMAFPNDLMPFPLETVGLAWELVASGDAFYHVGWTLWLTLWGFLGAIVLGGGMGVLMGINDYGQNYLTPYIIAGLSVPAIAWAAVTTLVFGFGATAPIVATILTTFPFIAINVWTGVADLDADLIEMGQSFETSNSRLLFHVILPNAAPSLFTAIRFGLAISWKIVTISEVFAGSRGIGYMMMHSYEFFRFERAWAWAVLFMAIILFIEYAVLKPIERKVFAYRQDADFDLIV